MNAYKSHDTMIHLYLSYIPNFITEQHLRRACDKLNLFSVKQITLHSNNNNNNNNNYKHFRTGYVFIQKWYDNEKNDYILNELKQGKSVYLLYMFPLYIKCSILKKNEYNRDLIKM